MEIQKFIDSPQAYYKVLQKTLKTFYWQYAKKGNVVHCGICSWKGQQFFKGACPKCGSLARTRLIPYSIHYFNLGGAELDVLHVAPNENEYLACKGVLGTVNRYDRLNIRPVKGVNLVQDLRQMTLPDAIYDYVIIWHVFEHIVEDHKAIAEVYRVLRPGGKLLMSVPIYPNENPKTFEDPCIPYEDYERVHGHSDHCRSCGLDYFERFEKVGFSTESLKVKELSEAEVTWSGLSRGHVVWCFTK